MEAKAWVAEAIPENITGSLEATAHCGHAAKQMGAGCSTGAQTMRAGTIFGARRSRSSLQPMSATVYSPASAFFSRTSMRIAACGMTRYFFPSKVISTAALRKKRA